MYLSQQDSTMLQKQRQKLQQQVNLYEDPLHIQQQISKIHLERLQNDLRLSRLETSRLQLQREKNLCEIENMERLRRLQQQKIYDQQLFSERESVYTQNIFDRDYDILNRAQQIRQIEAEKRYLDSLIRIKSIERQNSVERLSRIRETNIYSSPNYYMQRERDSLQTSYNQLLLSEELERLKLENELRRSRQNLLKQSDTISMYRTNLYDRNYYNLNRESRMRQLEQEKRYLDTIIRLNSIERLNSLERKIRIEKIQNSNIYSTPDQQYNKGKAYREENQDYQGDNNEQEQQEYHKRDQTSFGTPDRPFDQSEYQQFSTGEKKSPEEKREILINDEYQDKSECLQSSDINKSFNQDQKNNNGNNYQLIQEQEQ